MDESYCVMFALIAAGDAVLNKYIKVACGQPGVGSHESNAPPPAKFLKLEVPAEQSSENVSQLPVLGKYTR